MCESTRKQQDLNIVQMPDVRADFAAVFIGKLLCKRIMEGRVFLPQLRPKRGLFKVIYGIHKGQVLGCGFLSKH